MVAIPRLAMSTGMATLSARRATAGPVRWGMRKGEQMAGQERVLVVHKTRHARKGWFGLKLPALGHGRVQCGTGILTRSALDRHSSSGADGSPQESACSGADHGSWYSHQRVASE